MLYDIDDESQDIIVVEELNKKKINKKIIICGIIIFICLIIILAGVIFLNNKKNKSNENINNVTVSQKAKNTEKNKNDNKYLSKHVQIKKHSIEDIKMNFIPKQNLNAQQDISNIYYSSEKIAYLTFDDGPSKNITPLILDILKQESVPATFFVLGSRVELNPDLVKREYEEGHYIANHGYSHQYSKIYESSDTVFEEYIKCENSIRNALGNQNYNTFLFRFPGGSSGGKYADLKSQAKEHLHNCGVNYTNWNCLTGDAEGKTTPEALMEYLKESMQGDGSLIILMHDASDKSYTAETLPMVISYLREQGYVFKNFYEIFK